MATRYSANRPHRRSIRLPEYDYAQPGGYFVTICTHQHKPLFGEVPGEEMALNDFGRVARACWDDIPLHFLHVEVDTSVIMPNHLHGILLISDTVGGPTHASPLQASSAHASGPKRGSIGAIVGSFKSAVSKRMNQLRNAPGETVWQRNYWEHVIRSERALDAIRQYIADNPARWALDRYHPAPTGRDPRAAELWRMLQEDATAVGATHASSLQPRASSLQPRASPSQRQSVEDW